MNLSIWHKKNPGKEFHCYHICEDVTQCPVYDEHGKKNKSLNCDIMICSYNPNCPH
jgi:hypothetical protein